MLRNHFKIAYRNLKRLKFYSTINLLGLALGLTVGALILMFVSDELSFDRFQKNGHRIYKIATKSGDGSIMETNAWPIAHFMKEQYPEIESTIYARSASSSMMVNYEGKRYEHDIHYASEAFFDLFSFELIEGNPSTALKEPFSIVITKDIREKYFGSDLVLGKSITLRDSLTFKITGVIDEVPKTSHIQFEMLASFKSYENLVSWFSYIEGWGNFNVKNYVLVKEGTDRAALQEKVKHMYLEHVGDWLKEMGREFYVELIPFNEVYLESDVYNSFGPKGSLTKMYLVLSIAIFVILLACINFINLSTARAVYRAKEVGMRKIVGCSRTRLFWQFMVEAIVLTVIAFLSVGLLVELALPTFNELLGKSYHLTDFFTPIVTGGMILLILIVAFLAGFYPAWVLSGYNPKDVLKVRLDGGKKGVNLRRSLVVFQFVISGGLVLATLLVLDQLHFMTNQHLGFEKEQVLIMDATRVPNNAGHEAFKNNMRSLSQVETVSFANAIPGRPGWQGQWAYPEGRNDEGPVTTEYMAIDEQYIDALGLEIIAGRNFNLDMKAELQEGLIINETTVKEMGWLSPENAIGKEITSPSNRPAGKVIAVVKDYHGLGLQEEIWPKAMDYASHEYGRYYMVRFTTDNTTELLKYSEKFWSENFGDYAFEYFFLDDDFDRQYRAEQKLAKIFVIFAIMSIIIAGIGLLGLVSFMVAKKTKEIGIRKVLGASVMNIARLLSKEYMVLVVLANLITIPLVWLVGNNWLNNFAYHTQIDPTIFMITLGGTIMIALMTVSFQAVKAAMKNPTEALRDD